MAIVVRMLQMLLKLQSFAEQIVKCCEIFDFGAVQTCGNLGDLGNCCKKILFAKSGFNTAENEPSKGCYKGLPPYHLNAWIYLLQPSAKTIVCAHCGVVLE